MFMVIPMSFCQTKKKAPGNYAWRHRGGAQATGGDGERQDEHEKAVQAALARHQAAAGGA